MNSAGLVLLISILLSSAPARTGAVPARRSVDETISADISRGISDAGAIFASPLHFTAQQWAVTAGVVGGTALLLTADRSVRTIAARNHGSAADKLFDAGHRYGREIYGLSLGAALYAGGLAFGQDGVRTTGRMTVQSVVIAGVVNIALKSLIGRSRPKTGEGPFAFRGFQTSLERTSLTSGHATVAFAVSTVLARRIHTPYATAGLYALAGATALSRVYHDDHWISDSFLGAALGTAVGLSVTCERGAEADAGLLIEPSLSGLRLVYDF